MGSMTVRCGQGDVTDQGWTLGPIIQAFEIRCFKDVSTRGRTNCVKTLHGIY